jgi:hypothetical protein
MAKCVWRFVGDLKALARPVLLLKQWLCPWCGAAETLNRHSKLYGNDPAGEAANAQRERGQRVWCSSRGQRGGCGRSFSIFLSEVLPRHTVSAQALWSLLERWLGGGSVKAAAEALKLPYPLETLYHLLKRLRERLPGVRATLCRQAAAPPSEQSDPLLQSAEHLRRLFPRSGCPVAEFQRHFARPLLE